MNILCSICARGGSKGIKNKNLKKINNKPLIFYTINQAKKSKIFNKIVISSDSDKIIKYTKTLDIDFFIKRKKYLSNSKSNKVDAIRNLLIESENYFSEKYDIIVDLDVTSPLRTIDDIRKSIKEFIKNKNNILMSCTQSRKNPYYNIVENVEGRIKVVKKNEKKISRRQDAPNTYDLNASIYIWKRNILLKNNHLFGSKTGLYYMKQENSMDIDTIEDFNYVKWKIAKRKIK